MGRPCRRSGLMRGGSISEITDRFVRLDEATRSKPDPANVEKYRRAPGAAGQA